MCEDYVDYVSEVSPQLHHQLRHDVNGSAGRSRSPSPGYPGSAQDTRMQDTRLKDEPQDDDNQHNALDTHRTDR